MKINIRKLRQTVLTRILAGAAAIIVMLGLVFYACTAGVGNLISAYYSTHKIIDYLETAYPNEGYVVGPAHYMYSDGKYRYVCGVFNQNQIDTDFSAYYSHGTVYTTKSSETDSGINTYNRFRNELANELDTVQLCRSLKGCHPYSAFVSFYPGQNENVFSSDNPVFKPNAEFDKNNLPLPTVLSMVFWFDPDMGCIEVTPQMAAEYPIRLKAGTAEQNLTYDYYSIEIMTSCDSKSILDVPYDKIPESKDDAEGTEALISYLEERFEHPNQYRFFAPPEDAAPLADQKYTYMNEVSYQPCPNP